MNARASAMWSSMLAMLKELKMTKNVSENVSRSELLATLKLPVDLTDKQLKVVARGVIKEASRKLKHRCMSDKHLKMFSNADIIHIVFTRTQGAMPPDIWRQTFELLLEGGRRRLFTPLEFLAMFALLGKLSSDNDTSEAA